MTNKNDQVFYQTDSRIALLEKSVSFHEKEISDIKQNHREMIRLLFDKLDGMKKEIHSLSLASKDIVIHQQKEANKNKLWMLGIVLGFIAQSAVGVFLLLINKGGL